VRKLDPADPIFESAHLNQIQQLLFADDLEEKE